LTFPRIDLANGEQMKTSVHEVVKEADSGGVLPEWRPVRKCRFGLFRQKKWTFSFLTIQSAVKKGRGNWPLCFEWQ
jgi:hypothetical protein